MNSCYDGVRKSEEELKEIVEKHKKLGIFNHDDHYVIHDIVAKDGKVYYPFCEISEYTYLHCYKSWCYKTLEEISNNVIQGVGYKRGNVDFITLAHVRNDKAVDYKQCSFNFDNKKD